MPQQPLQTAGETYKRRLHYERSAIGVMGTWNPDASFANLRDNDFPDIYNLRMQTIGGYELRTGYNKYIGTSTSSLEILCKAEYRLKINNTDTLFDITIYQFATQIKVSAINRSVVPGSSVWTPSYQVKNIQDSSGDVLVCSAPDITGAINPPAIAGAYQYGSYLIITVFGIGTFAIYPNSQTADIWTLIPLGKNLADTPWEINFADTTTGDMLLTQYTERVDTTNVYVAHHWTPTPNPDRTSAISKILPPYLYTRIPLNMKYKMSADTGFANTEHKYFLWGKDDPASTLISTRATTHVHTKAWGYRFVQIRSFIDAKGNKIKFRSQASADVWVRDTVYCPPQVYDTVATSPLSKKQQFTVTGPEAGALIAAASPHGFTNVTESAFFPYPVTGQQAKASNTDIEDLTNAFIKFYGQTQYSPIGTINDQNSGGTNTLSGFDETTLLFAMTWLGFKRIWFSSPPNFPALEVDFDGAFKDAWFTEVPASVLKSAPLTVFKWTDFSTTDGTTANPDFPSDVESIEIYRTAWSDSDSKLTDGDPSFQPHLYGLVGSIQKDGTFTDDISDLDIDFSLTPDAYDGFLTGQFSGQVIREYNNKLAIGNCSTSYYVFNPWTYPVAIPLTSEKRQFQLFVATVSASSGPGSFNDLITPALDGLSTVFYGLQYVDSEGNVSDIEQVICDPHSGAVTITGYTDAYISIPTGYDPSITGINVWFSINNASTSFIRQWVLVKTASPNDETAVVHYADVVGGPFVAPTAKVIKTDIEGGELIWCDTNEMFSWPPLNSRIVSKTANITALESVVGELMIFSDTRIDYDNISITNPRGEEVSKWVGSVGRFTYCKVDKIVFFLSANGLFFAEPGGVVPFPANVQSVVLTYIREQIHNVPDMANARRATLGYNAKRYELWLYFPSSVDLGGTLPEITIIYKFFNPDITKSSVSSFINYHFDLRLSADTALATPSAVNKPIFLTTSDGKLFVSYKETNGMSFNLATIDEDTARLWTDTWGLEHAYGLAEMNLAKILREVMVSGDFNGSDLKIRTSQPNPAGAVNFSYINPVVPDHNYTVPPGGNNVGMKHRVGGTELATASVQETTAFVPIIRLEQKTGGINGVINIKAIDALYWVLHAHPN